MSDPINIDIILHDDNLSRHRHNGMITHSYYVGTIRTKMNKNRGQRMKYTWHSPSLSHLRSLLLEIPDLKRMGGLEAHERQEV